MPDVLCHSVASRRTRSPPGMIVPDRVPCRSPMGKAVTADAAVTITIRGREMKQLRLLTRFVGGAGGGDLWIEPAGVETRDRLGRGALRIDKAKSRVVAAELAGSDVHYRDRRPIVIGRGIGDRRPQGDAAVIPV